MNKTYFPLLGLLAFLILCAAQLPVWGQGAGLTPSVLTLEDAVKAALNRSPEMRISEAQARRAGLAAQEARSLNRPQIGLGTGLAYNNGFPLSLDGSAPSLIEVGVSLPLLSKKNNNLILEADLQKEIGRLGVESAQEDLTAKTLVAYDDLFRAQKVEAIWSLRVQGAIQEQEIRESQLHGGRSRPLDVALAKTAVAQARQQLLMAHEQVELAEGQLRELTGIAQDTIVRLSPPHLQVEIEQQPMATLLPSVLRQNPEIRKAEMEVQARTRRLEANRGERYPKVDVVGRYSLLSRMNHYQDFYNRFERNNYLVGLSIQVPVFDGHRTDARLAQSHAEVEEASGRLEQLKSELKLALGRVLSSLRVARGALEVAALELETARENLGVQQSLLEAGRIQPVDMAAARDRFHTVEIGSIEASSSLFRRQIELMRLCSRLSSHFASR